MKRIFFLIIIYFLVTRIFAQTIDIVSIIRNETSLTISVKIINNEVNDIWFHYKADIKLEKKENNILYYTPNYSFRDRSETTLRYSHFNTNVEKVLLKQNEEIIVEYILNGEKKVVEFSSAYPYIENIPKKNYSGIDLLVLSLVFFEEEIPEIIDEKTYRELFLLNGYVKTVKMPIK